MAASASRRSSISNANSARRGFIRWHRSRPISSFRMSRPMCWVCRNRSDDGYCPVDIDRLRGWIGGTDVLQDVAAAAPLAGLAALLDHETPPWPKDEVPPLGHWLYFLPRAHQSEIDVAGHPRRGGFLPPVDLPRRMFAGAVITFHAPISVGAKIERVSTILDVTEKSGASGR